MKTALNEIKNIRFLKFCIIGALNTIIHLIVYNILLKLIDKVVISHTIAFVIASLFSYFANATFTYKEKMERRTFYLAMITFIIKLIINAGLAKGFEIIIKLLELDFLIKFIPLFITAILLPLQYLIFNRIFKKSGELINDDSI